MQVLAWPENYFSAGVHFSGRVTAKFNKLGTIPGAYDLGDSTSVFARKYNDGYVSTDTRTDDNGNPILDDGRTNNWSYSFASQVTSDQGSIAFHSYSTTTEGASVSASSGGTAGIDLEYARRLFAFGRAKLYRERPGSVGILFGFSVNDLSAKTSATITANLHTVTDTYSLLGATPPDPGYVAPSSTTSTATSADGTSSTATVDTTTFLANRPDSRTETDLPGGAKINGTWGIRGAYYTVRGGTWFRWQPKPNISVRASLGGSVTILGVRLKYNETLDLTDVAETTGVIGIADETKNYSYAIPGAFSSVDLEWWMTQRTGFFGGVTYEKFSRRIDLTSGGRDAQIDVSSGAGLRIGIITRF